MTATRRYTLAELLDQCDAQAPIPQGIKDWEAAPSAGREVL
jgi:antitoxin component of MazEF toxin-antitoxin module